MLFNSIEYLFFLPVVFVLYWAIGYAKIKDSLKLRLQNAFVIVASYVFYGWWNWRFLILIAFTSLCSYASGLLIDKHYTLNSTHKRLPSFWLWLNIAINLGILAVFKYYDFFVTELITTFFPESVQPSLLHSFTLKIILPVGISFYTFQALSYSIDVYRGNIKPTKDIIAFFAYISFFPQLVAGPIERATNLLPQFLQKRTFSYEQGVDGMRQILWGLFKKIVIADNCATYVDQVWSTYGTQSGSTLLLAAILFTFQIYGDFSGYSDIAIGTAKLFGIRLMRNFNNPYFSRDIAEFWRRWHISLTTWFRDYVYIPLGGSRNGQWRTIANTFVVFILCAIWHGANWTYLAWGLYHVLLFVPLILRHRTKQYKHTDATWRQIPQILLTFALVVIGWIIFRAPSVADAWGYLCGMCSSTLCALPCGVNDYTLWVGIAMIVLMLCFEWHFRKTDVVPVPRSVWLYFVLVELIWWFAGHHTSDFIYFQF